MKTIKHTIGLLLLAAYLPCMSWAAPALHFSDPEPDELEAYPTSPSQVLPIQPVLIYPKPRENLYQARTLAGRNDDQDIIFVKLLQDKSQGYRPKQQRLVMEETKSSQRKNLGLKDIFYVKALTNGRFSHERLKVYRVPEFYAISVFSNGDK
ncbi:uncharacterized protein LOC6728134 [Drosophila simulans]|uniref:GD20452 n=1 Tax=Drosophila simulans TaxID=7240 RepID=B4R0H3_DROSI|nr:uncharacterized protein LOC6728134 [Drosophila simulans]EDX12988.1 GD20452 [Drosophila simulans]KMZ03657.1 uncharacterized protein Dsimw501_GD20452 [Drosophila simulans]